MFYQSVYANVNFYRNRVIQTKLETYNLPSMVRSEEYHKNSFALVTRPETHETLMAHPPECNLYGTTQPVTIKQTLIIKINAPLSESVFTTFSNSIASHIML